MKGQEIEGCRERRVDSLLLTSTCWCVGVMECIHLWLQTIHIIPLPEGQSFNFAVAAKRLEILFSVSAGWHSRLMAVGTSCLWDASPGSQSTNPDTTRQDPPRRDLLMSIHPNRSLHHSLEFALICFLMSFIPKNRTSFIQTTPKSL